MDNEKLLTPHEHIREGILAASMSVDRRDWCCVMKFVFKVQLWWIVKARGTPSFMRMNLQSLPIARTAEVGSTTGGHYYDYIGEFN